MQRQALVESLARDRDRKLMLERLYNDALAEPAAVRAGTASGRGQQSNCARGDVSHGSN